MLDEKNILLWILGNMNLTDINETGIINLKQAVELKDLLLNTPYSIVVAKIVISHFGEVVLLEFKNFKCFLSRSSPLENNPWCF